MYIKERGWESVAQIAGSWRDVVNSVTKFCVIHTVHVLVISILSNKCISWYNTRDIHKLLHVSTPRFQQ